MFQCAISSRIIGLFAVVLVTYWTGAMRKQTINEAMELKAQKRKKNRKRIKRLVFWVKSICILALLVAAIVYTGLSPLFDLKEIEVKGAVHYKPEILTGYADIRMGENGFRQIGRSPLDIILFRFGDAEASIIKNCPYIKEARVRFAIPSKVVINVTEREAIATVPYLGTSLLIDREGYVLESLAADKKAELLLIRGLEFSYYDLGKKLDIKNRDSLTIGLKLIEALKENDKSDTIKIFEIVDYMDVGDDSNILFLCCQYYFTRCECFCNNSVYSHTGSFKAFYNILYRGYFTCYNIGINFQTCSYHSSRINDLIVSVYYKLPWNYINQLPVIRNLNISDRIKKALNILTGNLPVSVGNTHPAFIINDIDMHTMNIYKGRPDLDVCRSFRFLHSSPD
jgi:cell division protein FtsQ